MVFPVLTLVPIGEGSKTNHFTIPRVRGIVANDPFNAQRGFGTESHRGNPWPGGLNMQFHSLYDDAGTGLYLATYDGQGYRKMFYVDQNPDRQMMTYKVAHFPANMGYPAENYSMTYDVCIGPFKGDWYDACQIYRQWGIQQKWCRQGPLRTRKDMPKWYKECPLVLKTQSPYGDRSVTAMRDRMLAVLKLIEMDLPIDWYMWQQFFPDKSFSSREGCEDKVPDSAPFHDDNVHDGIYPLMPSIDSFSSACKELFEAGGRVKAFVPAKLYDPGMNENAPFAAQAKPNAVRDLQGKVFIGWHQYLWKMCYNTPWWQNRLKDEVVALFKNENVHGVYFDTFYGGTMDDWHASRYQCFSTEHSHSHGGGNYAYLGACKHSQVVRGAMKQVDPQAVMTGENPSETAIDLLDGFLLYWPVRAEMAPLLATVYGDYICRSSVFLIPDSDGFYLQAAAMFTEGGQMGRLRFQFNYDNWMKDFDAGSPYTDKMKFLRKLCHYWKPQAAGRFLAYGQLLRPIKFTKPDLMPVFSYSAPSRY